MFSKPLQIFAIIIAILSISNYSFSQCYYSGDQYRQCTSGIMAIADCKIHDGTFSNPYPPHDPILLKLGTHCGNNNGGGNGEFYSLDLENNVIINQTYHDSGSNVTDYKVLYLLYHYEEYLHGYPGELASIDEECAAIQIVLHHLTEGLDLNTMDTVAPGAAAKKRIHTRAWAILNDVNTNFSPRTVITPIQFIPEADPNQFRIKVVDMDGNPQGGISVDLCLSDSSASLNDYNKTTNGTTGLTGIFTISGATSGVKIGARANDCKLPCGRIFANSGFGSKKLVLTGNVADNYLRGDFCDETTYGVLPVELASFTAVVNGRNINLNWTTVQEQDNSGFEIYRTRIGTDIFEKIGFVNGNGTSDQQHSYSYADRNMTSGRYTYRIKQIDINGNFKWYALGTEIGIGVPVEFELSQNYPNPFNPSTTINFDLPADAFVKIKVYDISGKEVGTIVNEVRSAGYHTVTYDASALSSGIYYYKIETAGFSKVRKMALVK